MIAALRGMLAFLTPARALIAVLAIGLAVQWCRLNNLQVEHAKVEGALSAAKARLESVGEQLKAQNAAVAALEAAGAKQREAVARAAEEANRLRADASKRVVLIQKEFIPSGCDAAVDWLADKAKAQSHW